MNITSNILGELGGATKLAQTSPHETEVIVPPVIQPVTLLRTLVRNIVGLSNSNLLMNISFIGSWQNQVANAGALFQSMFTLDTGIWEVDFLATYSANYAVTPSNGGIIVLSDSVNSANLFEGVCAVTLGGMVAVSRKLQIQSDKQLIFSAKLGANGVGNIHDMALAFSVSRLL